MFSVAVLSDGRIVSGSLDETVRIWDASSGECVKVLSGHTAVSGSYHSRRRRRLFVSVLWLAVFLCVLALRPHRICIL